MRVSDFDFELPERLIAQHARARGESRLLAVDRKAGAWRELTFRDLPSLVDPGDLLAVNDTRVFAARLLGRRDPSGGAVECFLLSREEGDTWQALVHPGQKLKPGTRFIVDDPVRAPGTVIRGEVLDRLLHGRRRVRLEAGGALPVDAAVDALGHIPLPPYIHRADTEEDRARYQTVFARERGSIAAPTAGLHFDARVLEDLAARGVACAPVTLHVGYGTFKPVRVEEVEAHVVDPEAYEISAETALAIRAARSAGQRVVAVGTTTTRALEHWGAAEPPGEPSAGMADLFIYPGHRFRVVDGLVTNFHLPRSSLFMLACAFAGRELLLEAYRDAIRRDFTFYSYGDAMVIL
ncbi:MAG: tRNA preQ1(34) S-adenosylmethionine ribosyltransferase-isomerase QueA [Acidobacteriota bacterium]|nr:tRNA preQ1(34) S-adenosylmethionine ribosyltransferase-isomerase QueA [Acidobacteriota bacterium]